MRTDYVHDVDRRVLLDYGGELVADVLDRSGITWPKFLVAPTRVAFKGSPGEFGYYKRGTVYLNLEKCRLPTRTPGFSWSFPGYKADLTPIGVLAHETGHHVDALLEFPRLVGWSKEPRVTSYEPNRGEAFAEAFKLFVTNPDLLRIGRPYRWALLCELGLDPGELVPWDEVLRDRGAHEKFFTAARNWAKRGGHDA